jgi:hypothetical protein
MEDEGTKATASLEDQLRAASLIEDAELKARTYDAVGKQCLAQIGMLYQRIELLQTESVLNRVEKVFSEPALPRSKPQAEHNPYEDMATASVAGPPPGYGMDAMRYEAELIAEMLDDMGEYDNSSIATFKAGIIDNLTYREQEICRTETSPESWIWRYGEEAAETIWTMSMAKHMRTSKHAQAIIEAKKKGQEAVNRVEADMRARDNNSYGGDKLYGGNNSRW